MAYSISGDSTYSHSKTDSSSQGRESTSSSVRRLDDQTYQELQRTLRRMQAGAEEEDPRYSKQAAINDTKGIVDSIFADYADTALPQILERQGQSGGYSSTGTQLLANDAYSRTTAKASEVVLQAIQGYAATQNEKRQTSIQGLGTVLEGLLAAREDSTSSSTFNTSSRSRTSGWSKKISGSYSGF